jgi:hypothetical protein
MSSAEFSSPFSQGEILYNLGRGLIAEVTSGHGYPGCDASVHSANTAGARVAYVRYPNGEELVAEYVSGGYDRFSLIHIVPDGVEPRFDAPTGVFMGGPRLPFSYRPTGIMFGDQFAPNSEARPTITDWAERDASASRAALSPLHPRASAEGLEGDELGRAIAQGVIDQLVNLRAGVVPGSRHFSAGDRLKQKAQRVWSVAQGVGRLAYDLATINRPGN